MDKQESLFKGEMMEEQLRSYFLNLGYFVARSVKFSYENNTVTDVDLYLYGRSSTLNRSRINVDIKNRKSPQVFERILWANGLMRLLNFDSCVVATTDRKPVIHAFGKLHGTIILDGAFLAKLRSSDVSERLTEEEILFELSKYKTYKKPENKDWRFLYETSKSRLLTEQDFSGFNSTLKDLSYFIEKAMTDRHKRDIATRMVYLLISHLLIIIDFILKDIVFLEQSDREKKLYDGFNFGNLGKEGVDKIISMAVHISGKRSANEILKSLEDAPIEILKDFFSRNETTKNVFAWARDFENLGFKRTLINPDRIDAQLKGVISMLLDFLRIHRNKFFEPFLKRE